MAEAADLQAGFVPHRKAEGAERALHALSPQPFLGMRDQRPEDRLVLRFHHTPIAGARAHALRGGLGEREMVDMRGHSAAHATVALREEELRLGMAETDRKSGGSGKRMSVSLDTGGRGTIK